MLGTQWAMASAACRWSKWVRLWNGLQEPRGPKEEPFSEWASKWKVSNALVATCAEGGRLDRRLGGRLGVYVGEGHRLGCSMQSRQGLWLRDARQARERHGQRTRTHERQGTSAAWVHAAL